MACCPAALMALVCQHWHGGIPQHLTIHVYPFEFYHYHHTIGPSPWISWIPIGLPPHAYDFHSSGPSLPAQLPRVRNEANDEPYNFNIQVITHPLKLSQHLMWWDQYQRIKMIKIGIFWRSETQLQCVHQALGVYQVAAILKDKICQTQTFSIQNAKYLLLSCFKGWLTKGLMSLFCLPGFGHLLAPPWYFQASSRLTSLQKSR